MVLPYAHRGPGSVTLKHGCRRVLPECDALNIELILWGKQMGEANFSAEGDRWETLRIGITKRP